MKWSRWFLLAGGSAGAVSGLTVLSVYIWRVDVERASALGLLVSVAALVLTAAGVWIAWRGFRSGAGTDVRQVPYIRAGRDIHVARTMTIHQSADGSSQGTDRES